MIRCLAKFGDVDVVFLQKEKYGGLLLSLFVFAFSVLTSLRKSYTAYFSKSFVASAMLLLLRGFWPKKVRVVHQAYSVPFPTSEIAYLKTNRFERLLRYHLGRFLEEVVYSKADIVTVAAGGYAKDLIGQGVGKDRIAIVAFYVEDEFFKQPIKKEPGEVFTYCYSGNFHPYHDLSTLVQAFELTIQSEPNVRLLLIGDGLSRPEIENEVYKRKLGGKTTFKGRVQHKALPLHLSEADCFVSLLRTPGLSISLLEAAAAGKAILTYKRKGDTAVEEYFRPQKEIYMVNSNSPAEIADAMKVLLRNSKLRYALASGARKVALQYFSDASTTRQLHELLHRLI
jgi:glycosyltransferase involved in cell wall biosynthesis